MYIKLASLNARCLRVWSKAAHMLCDLLSFSVDVAAIKERHFLCNVDAHVLSSNFVVYSAYRDQLTWAVSLLVKHTLGAKVDLVNVHVGGQLIVANIAVSSSLFWIVAVCAPNYQMEHGSFSCQLDLFLVNLSRLFIMGHWNAILDPKLGDGKLAGSQVIVAWLIWLASLVSSIDTRLITQKGRCSHEFLGGSLSG